MGRALRERFGRQLIAIALELDKGPLVYALQKYDGFVLFPVNPTMLAKYREAFTPSGAKDDPTDAELALQILLRHPEALKGLKPQSAPMRSLVQLVQDRRRLVSDKVRITNRLINALKNYFPQPLQWFRDRDTVLFCDFLSRWPTLKQLKRARRSVLEAFFYEHNVRRRTVIEERIEAIRSALPLTEDPAIIEPQSLLVAMALIAQLRCALDAIERFNSAIEATTAQLPDYAIFSSLPGAGPTFAPRLLAAFGEDRERYQRCEELQKYSGIAPVTERSGTEVLGPLALPRADVLTPDLRRVGRGNDPSLVLGQGVLRAAAQQRALASSRSTNPCLQVDPHPLPMLARPYAVRRIAVPHGSPQARRPPAQSDAAQNPDRSCGPPQGVS